ncbi:glycosyltransferase family 22 protein [Macrolepiota fuliginosa MF-IS2]|uniref:Mannosyltransferase n=1 Tax=Macrolepiota fuliginosa MF-IS2 TaxID=1400762 RepID=A0A9P5XCJ7_9AGAR|nr:glycosyltransferase family 22 protein [Macrolepiota fuliginosa MF-IS2]
MDRRVTSTSLAVRTTIALFTWTVFQPDEYFQSLEPAFHCVFGYGHLTWEWLSEAPIRSIIYPALNIPIYWFLEFTGLAYTGSLGDILLILLPKILHGALAAVTDIWLCELVRATLGNDYTLTALLLSLSSFFHALALPRSLSNSLETSLSTVAFAYYPWDASSKLSPHVLYNRLRKTLIFSALACMIRPTNGVIWVFLYFRVVWLLRRHSRIISTIVLETILTGALALTTLFALDSFYYGRPIFTPYNFLKTNLSSVSLFYGSSPWHYYLTQALPILCTTALPFTLHGILTILQRGQKGASAALGNMLGVLVWAITIYSLAGHKEWRFIHPLLPLLHVFATKSLVDLSSTKRTQAAKSKMKKPRPTHPLSSIRLSYLIFILATLPASIYVVLFYCSAPISVLSYLRSLPINATTINGTPQPQSVGFLMPCHSTPGQAYLHRPTWEVWSLGCEPPLHGQELSTYRDQTDIFFDSPRTYITSTFPDDVNPEFPRSPYPASTPGVPPLSSSDGGGYPWRHTWPRYLVFFGALLDKPGMMELLEEKGYVEVWRRGRDWEGGGERTGGVRVWRWQD